MKLCHLKNVLHHNNNYLCLLIVHTSKLRNTLLLISQRELKAGLWCAEERADFPLQSALLCSASCMAMD